MPAWSLGQWGLLDKANPLFSSSPSWRQHIVPSCLVLEINALKVRFTQHILRFVVMPCYESYVIRRGLPKRKKECRFPFWGQLSV